MPFSDEVNNFMSAVDVGDDVRAEELIGEMPNNILQTAYRRTLCNVKNTETIQKDSEYRSMLSIILGAMTSKGLSPKNSVSKRMH